MKTSKIIRYSCLVASLILFHFACKSSNINSFEYDNITNQEVHDSIIIEESLNRGIVNIKISPFRILFGELLTNSFAIGCGFETQIRNNHSYDIGLYLLLRRNSLVFFESIPESVNKLIGYNFYFDRKNYFLKKKQQFNSPYWSYSLTTFFTYSKQGFPIT